MQDARYCRDQAKLFLQMARMASDPASAQLAFASATAFKMRAEAFEAIDKAYTQPQPQTDSKSSKG